MAQSFCFVPFSYSRPFNSSSFILEESDATRVRITFNPVKDYNPKDDKKAYRAKSALAKSLTAKTIYLEKNIKKLQRKKQIIEYIYKIF